VDVTDLGVKVVGFVNAFPLWHVNPNKRISAFFPIEHMIRSSSFKKEKIDWT
jgi:hypothetical protein